MRILIVTDAWYPQINGVVRTLDTLRKELTRLGHEIHLITPEPFRTLPCPTYPEIRLAVRCRRGVARMIDSFQPAAIHISTEGPLGLAARRHCLKKGYDFTTAFHTRFPEYVQARWWVPTTWTYRWVRWFHGPASAIMVSTQTIEDALKERGFGRIRRWSRGVDTELFRPRDKGFLTDPRPISMYVGRIAVEKNVEAFLSLDLPGTKYVVGDGPQMAELKSKFPDTVFTGAKTGEDLARHYAAADIFVFPSLTDTFGLVMLEALACGVPVAAHPVEGPLDVIGGSNAGVLDADLGKAVRAALEIPPDFCRAHAETYSWEASARQFLSNLQVLDPPAGTTAHRARAA
ncbi:MAG: glycosyltransferase family 1 protein [Rhodospirillales bacterium]|nr:glycosyltransferase family 1 protein [Rhodospirillales bacterium]